MRWSNNEDFLMEPILQTDLFLFLDIVIIIRELEFADIF